MRNPGSAEKPSVLVCSDDAEARTVVMTLAEDIGFSSIDGGGLRSARYTEGLGVLWTALAFDAGYGERATYRVYVARG